MFQKKTRRPPLSKAISAAFCALTPALVTPALVSASPAHAAAPFFNHDGYQTRLEIEALIETLNGNLLASRSATETLAAWCAAHHMADPPKIIAHVLKDEVKPISAAQRRDLDISADEPVAYRSVELVCGSHVLSRADNWYVPSRLSAAMNAALKSTDRPFGLVIKPLHPRRHTLAVTFDWQALPVGWELQRPQDIAQDHLAIPAVLFEHRAIVVDGADRPVAEVIEHYTDQVLDFHRQD